MDDVLLSMNLPVPRLLVILPNGDALRADMISAVRVLQESALPQCERPRYSVMVHLDEGEPLRVAVDLAQRDAVNMARQIARAINDALVNPGANGG